MDKTIRWKELTRYQLHRSQVTGQRPFRQYSLALDELDELAVANYSFALFYTTICTNALLPALCTLQLAAYSVVLSSFCTPALPLC